MPKPPAAASLPAGETFADLDRACTRFLLERDPTYRKTYEKYQRQRDSINALRAKKAPSSKL